MGGDAGDVVPHDPQERADRHTDLVDEGLHREADAFRPLARLELEVLDRVADHGVGDDVGKTRRHAGDDYREDGDDQRSDIRVVALAAAVDGYADDERDEQRRAAGDIGPDVRLFLSYLLCEERHEHGGYEPSRDDRDGDQRVKSLAVHTDELDIVKNIFAEVEPARVGEDHARRAQDARNDDEHEGLVLEQQLEVVLERRRILDGIGALLGALEADEEERGADRNADDRRDEVIHLRLLCLLSSSPLSALWRSAPDQS